MYTDIDDVTESDQIANAISEFIERISGMPVSRGTFHIGTAFDYTFDERIVLTVQINAQTRPFFVFDATPNGHLFRAMERHLHRYGYRFESESENEVVVYRDPFQ